MEEKEIKNNPKKIRILHITPQAPDVAGGGCIGVSQTIKSISKIPDVIIDYLGPEITNDYADLYNNKYYLSRSSKFQRILNVFKGITEITYNSWKKQKITYDYDYYILEFTKQKYILKKIDPSKTLVRVHNVEYDFSKSEFKLKKNIKKWLIYKFSKKDEKAILKRVDKAIPLTNRDLNRLVELYNVDKEKMHIIPVCIEKNNPIIIRKRDKLELLITGSLWYGANVEGIIWFIENVFGSVENFCHLTIAGSKPSTRLIEIIKENPNISLIDSPKEMEPFFTNSDIVIAPLFSGAGMKVKVAEAMSYSIPVIGTDEAFVGYEITNEVNAFVANDSKSFTYYLEKIYSMSVDERVSLSKSVEKNFMEKNNIDVSTKEWKDLLK